MLRRSTFGLAMQACWPKISCTQTTESVAVMRSNQRSACDESIQAAPLSLLSFPETPVEGLYLIWINSFAFFSAIGSVRVASHPRSLSILFAIGIFRPHSTVRKGAHCYITAPARPLLHQPRCRKLIQHVLPCGVPVPSPLPLPPDFAACSSIPR